MADVLVVASKVKAALKKKNLRTSAELIDALSAKVAGMLDEASKRAVEAKRQTVRAEDLDGSSN